MENKLNKIEEKIDIITSRLSSIDSTLVKQSVILDEHVKRTTQLENRVRPVENHVAMISGVTKFIGLIAVLAAIVEGMVALLEFIKGSGHA
jgi:hypothetical protein